jgi:hypothetical protein
MLTIMINPPRIHPAENGFCLADWSHRQLSDTMQQCAPNGMIMACLEGR